MDLPDLGLGTWQLTGDACVEGVRHALELGYDHVDTADIYGNHQAVAQGLRASSRPRDSYVLATKLWHTDLAPADVTAAVARFLRELDVDYLDLVYIHWPSTTGVPLADTLGALDQARELGHIRHVGVSNFPPAMLDQAVSHTTIDAIQVEHHPFLGQDALLDRCDAHGIALVAYSPLARGQVHDHPVLREIANAHDATPEQVTLAWLVRRAHRVAIPKAASAEHRQDNLAAARLELTGQEITRIDDLAEGRRLVSPSFAPDW